ncbi:hypothetical protein [Halorubrum halodurans]|uniref:Uncharacterized protein n=1 Tax=Halorubrum halodurans TaxID=1383851 RepID=A0A256IIT9_9EURY|nr:hypothetical protein [Halorubrum halodurans]OYR56037.1 hypothetical protein DJ70_10105 [Halorubrum halodurans]
MQRDYRLAIYALSIATVLLAASGIAVIAGATLSPEATGNPADEDNVAQLNGDQQQFNGSLTQTDGDEYTLHQAQRTCGGALRLNSTERNGTSHRVEDVTVTLVSHHNGSVVDEIGRQRLAELIVEQTGDRVGLSEYSQLEVRVNQYYESTAREEPLDIAGIRVRPTDDCLPLVRGTVNRTNETITVQTTRPDLDAVELNYSNDIGVLERDDRELIERLIVADEQASYNVQTHIDATELEATVVEATADEHVDIKLEHPDGSGSTVMLTVDLDSETVAHTWVEIQIDESNIKMIDENGSADGSDTIVRTDSVAIDPNESNITVVNETSG